MEGMSKRELAVEDDEHTLSEAEDTSLEAAEDSGSHVDMWFSHVHATRRAGSGFPVSWDLWGRHVTRGLVIPLVMVIFVFYSLKQIQ